MHRQTCHWPHVDSERHTLDGRQEDADGGDGRSYSKRNFHNYLGSQRTPSCDLGTVTKIAPSSRRAEGGGWRVEDGWRKRFSDPRLAVVTNDEDWGESQSDLDVLFRGGDKGCVSQPRGEPWLWVRCEVGGCKVMNPTEAGRPRGLGRSEQRAAISCFSIQFK